MVDVMSAGPAGLARPRGQILLPARRRTGVGRCHQRVGAAWRIGRMRWLGGQSQWDRSKEGRADATDEPVPRLRIREKGGREWRVRAFITGCVRKFRHAY